MNGPESNFLTPEQIREQVLQKRKVLFSQNFEVKDQEILLAQLASEVEKSEGKAVLLVHPFYEEHANLTDIAKRYTQDEKYIERLKECNKKIDELLTQSDRPPLIILEERTRLDAIIEHCILKGITLGKNVFLVESVEDRSTPFVEYSEDKNMIHPIVFEEYSKRKFATAEPKISCPPLEMLADEYRHRSWAMMYAILNITKVTDLEIGGKLLTSKEDGGIEDEQVWQRCVGEAYTALSWFSDALEKDKINIKINETTFPARVSDSSNK